MTSPAAAPTRVPRFLSAATRITRASPHPRRAPNALGGGSAGLLRVASAAPPPSPPPFCLISCQRALAGHLRRAASRALAVHFVLLVVCFCPQKDQKLISKLNVGDTLQPLSIPMQMLFLNGFLFRVRCGRNQSSVSRQEAMFHLGASHDTVVARAKVLA